MANSLNRLLHHTIEWNKIVHDSIEDQFCCIHSLIKDEICRVTTSLAELKIILPTSCSQSDKIQQITSLLAEHAKQIPSFKNPNSIKEYYNEIQSCLEIAKTNDSLQNIVNRVDALREKGFHLTAHNQQEIEEMIKAKGSLFKLKRITDYCTSVQNYKQNREVSPFRDRIELRKLQEKGNEFFQTDFLVLNRAKETLDLMLNPPQESPVESSVKIKPTPLSKRIITWMNQGTQSILNSACSVFKWICSPIRAFT